MEKTNKQNRQLVSKDAVKLPVMDLNFFWKLRKSRSWDCGVLSYLLRSVKLRNGGVYGTETWGSPVEVHECTRAGRYTDMFRIICSDIVICEKWVLWLMESAFDSFRTKNKLFLTCFAIAIYRTIGDKVGKSNSAGTIC